MLKHSNKLYELITDNGQESLFLFFCPGCHENHGFTVRLNGIGWQFNGNYQSPSFIPSLLHPSKPIRCHLWLTDGKIHYCDDCGHDLKNQIVDMVEFDV